MTLTDPSLFIVVVLGCAAGAVVIGALVFARRPRYQGPHADPYAGFRSGNGHTGQLLLLDCEGHCDGSTAHQTDDEDGATCVLCGTPRPIPVHDEA